jgi:hypothetical protein
MIDFTTDWEKMRDYFQISKEEFLASYSYVTEAEYDATAKIVDEKDEIYNKALQYKKYLADILYQDALRTSKAELQEVSFFQEETTDSWTLEQFQIQYVKDQISFFEAGNLDDQVNETWEKIND